MTTSAISNINFERTCRLCVKESSILNPICQSENSLIDLIKECVDIVVRSEDELPKHVCRECLSQMESWKSFKTTCQKSEDFLCSYVNKLHCSISSNEIVGDVTGIRNSSLVKIKEEKTQPVAEDENCLPKDDSNPECDKPPKNGDESSLPDTQILDYDDTRGTNSSTDSADSVEIIDITQDEAPKKNTSPLIRLANPEAFKLLIDAQFLEPNRNLYRSSCSENYFACTADKVITGPNSLLLELEKNVFCEVEFVLSGKSLAEQTAADVKDEEHPSVEVETILSEGGETSVLDVNESNSISYIILPENVNESSASADNTEEKKEVNPSILQSILKSKGESGSKEALMFHKYARPASEKAVKFLIPPSNPNPVNNVTYVAPTLNPTPQFYQISIPPNVQVVNQSNVGPSKGIKRSVSEAGIAKPHIRKQRLLPAPPPPPPPPPPVKQKPVKQLELRAFSSVSNKRPAKPPKKSNDEGPKLKTADDISRRIQQIIEANEEILQKTWGQYKKEEEEEMDEDENEDDIMSEAAESGLTLDQTGKTRSVETQVASLNKRFVLNPIQNQENSEALQKSWQICNEAVRRVTPGLSFGNEKLVNQPSPKIQPAPVPVVPVTIAPLPLPKVVIPQVHPGKVAIPRVMPPKTTNSSKSKAKSKSIHDLLFEGLDLETTSLDSTTEDAESIVADYTDAPQIKYTITEDGFKEPILLTNFTSKNDWKRRIPDELKMDPSTIPKNKQRSKILQKFYLPNEPVLLTDAPSASAEEDEVKDVLFWADQLPDPPKDDEIEGDQASNQNVAPDGIKRIRKRKRKPQKKKPKPRIYKCHLCKNIAYAKFYELTQHDKTFHSDLPSNEFCTICGKCFIFEDRVKWHSNIYHAEKTMFCDLCDKGFSNKERLQTHKKLHSDKFICDQCGYRASSSRKLTEHQRKHTGEKPYMCDICGMKLASKISVKQHAVKHAASKQGEKWQCKDCEYSSMNMTSFYHHRKKHLTVPTFLCEQCGQNVLTKSRLYKHMRFAHGPETLGHYECGECNGIFHSKNACDDHLKEKHNMTGQARSFVCKLCFKSYATKAACKKHFKTHNLQ